MAPERSPDESGLLVRELELHTLVDRTEGLRVDTRGQAKRQDLEHDGDATVR
jgi:hypothetical protein